jgi:hypothetical protein
VRTILGSKKKLRGGRSSEAIKKTGDGGREWKRRKSQADKGQEGLFLSNSL